MEKSANIVPSLRYHDAPAAIDWLCRVFGFEKHLVVPGDSDTVAHAQLTLAGGMIMLGSMIGKDEERTGLAVKPPRDLGASSHGVYVVIPEIDAHYERAKAAGAEVVSEIEDQEHGGRLYAARDPEGYVWYFGSYDPWQGA